MNCYLVGLIESNHFKSDKKMHHLIELNGRKLNAEEVRMVVRASVKAGYTELYDVPDEFAEAVLNNGITYQEAYKKALKAIPRDIRFVKTDDGEYERVDVNEKMRKEYAEQLVKNEEDE